jgi:hypothetical protein
VNYVLGFYWNNPCANVSTVRSGDNAVLGPAQLWVRAW